MDMTDFRVLVTDDVDGLLIDGLISLEMQVDYHPEISYEDFKKIAFQYNGVVINSKIKMTADVIHSCTQLKWIARLGSGLDIIDLEAARAQNVEVFRAASANAQAVAEHALGMILAFQHKLFQANLQLKQGIWEREINRGYELRGQTIGIIGFGNNGSALGKLLQGTGCQVLVYDKYLTNYADGMSWIQECSLNDVLGGSDIISLHVPLTEETFHLVNNDLLERCKKGVLLVNTSRGKVVDTADVTNSLNSGRIRGACLDVFEVEGEDFFSLEENRDLLAMDNVLLSPHVAGWSTQSKLNISRLLLKQIEKWKEKLR